MIRFIAVVAALVGLLVFRKDDQPAALPKPPKRLLAWNETEAHAAACAALTQGINDEDTLAKVVGEALYPGNAWPPSDTASTRSKNIWQKLQATARDAIAGGCAA